MSTGTQDVRIALRFLRRNPTFTVAAVAILALGISLGSTLYAIVRGALLEPWPYRDYDRLVTVAGNYPTQGRVDFSLWSVPEIEDLRGADDVFAAVMAGDARNVNLTYAGRAERVRAAVITPNAFAMLGVPATIGRVLSSGDAEPGAPPVVLVSYQFWETRLGRDPQIVGRTLRIADAPYTIVGVMPKAFVFWNRDLWMPLALDRRDARTDRRFYVQAQLQRGVTIEMAHARLAAWTAGLAAAHPEVAEYAGASVTLKSLVEEVLRDLRPTLYLLLGAVALVLIVTTANLTNATLAKAMSREGELAIRRAIGGSTIQIARQLLVESGLVGIAGGLAGALLAAVLLPRVLSLIPFGYVPAEAHVELDWRIVAAATGAALVLGLIIGALPAIRAAGIEPATLLRSGDTRTASRRSHGWRNGFVAAQLAMAVTVLGVAASALASLNALVNRDPGFRTDGIWTTRLALPPSDVAAHREWQTYDAILSRLSQDARVTDVALTSLFPVGALPTTLVSAEAAAATQRMATLDAATMIVSDGFFRLLQIPVLEGRTFTARDVRSQPAVAVVSRRLATRLWPEGSAIGRRITIGGDNGSIASVVGVVGDLVTDAADARVAPMVFVPAGQQPPVAATLGLKSSDPQRAMQAVDDAVRAVNADIPLYSPEMLAQSRLNVLGPKLLAVTLLGLFGVTVLALSSVGVYAVVSQSVLERSRELRIRRMFGAEPRRLFLAELTRTARIIVVSAGTGTLGAIAALRVLAWSFRGFADSSVAPVAGSTMLLVLLALAATALPAWRAVSPTDADGGALRG